MFIRATQYISKARVTLIHEVIPIIDKFDDLFTTMHLDASLHSTVRYAAKAALRVLRKYYAKTDECIYYRIAMSKSFACYLLTYFSPCLQSCIRRTS